MLGRKEKERKKVNFIWYLMRSEINRVRNNYREGLEAFCILQLNVDLNTFNRYRERHKCVCIYVYAIYIYKYTHTNMCMYIVCFWAAESRGCATGWHGLFFLITSIYLLPFHCSISWTKGGVCRACGDLVITIWCKEFLKVHTVHEMMKIKYFLNKLNLMETKINHKILLIENFK